MKWQEERAHSKFQFHLCRWIHPASGRIYSYSYKPPKVPGLDDVTGEELVQRPDDQPDKVRCRLDAYDEVRIVPYCKFFETFRPLYISNQISLISLGYGTLGRLLRRYGSLRDVSRNNEWCDLPWSQEVARSQVLSYDWLLLSKNWNQYCTAVPIHILSLQYYILRILDEEKRIDMRSHERFLRSFH